MTKNMRFAFAICLIVLAVAIVLGITYPSVGGRLSEGIENTGNLFSRFFDWIAESFREIFLDKA